MKTIACHECGCEHGIHATAHDRAECGNCGRVWSVDWSTKIGRVRVPKLTLIDDGDNHWSGIGSITKGILSGLGDTQRHRDQMTALQRMNDRHAECLSEIEDRP